MAKLDVKIDLDIDGKLSVSNIGNQTGDVVTVSVIDGKTISKRTNSQFINDLNLEVKSNKVNDLSNPNNTDYPSTNAVVDALSNSFTDNIVRVIDIDHDDLTTVSEQGIIDYLNSVGLTIGEKEIILLNVSEPIPLDPSTEAVLAYAETNSYQKPSKKYILKLDYLIGRLKSVGIWDQLDILYCMIGDGDLSFKSINLINPSISGTPSGGLSSTNLGIQGNAVDGLIYTNYYRNDFVKATGPNATAGFFVYSDYTGGTTNSGLLGLDGSTVSTSVMGINSSQIRFNYAGNLDDSIDLSGIGYKSINRDMSEVKAITENGITSSTSGSSNWLLGADNHNLFRRQNNYSGEGMSFFFMGALLDEGTQEIFKSIIYDTFEYQFETERVLAYAQQNGFNLPSKPYIEKLNKYIKDLKDNDLFYTHDAHYYFIGDGDNNFKCINIVDPNRFQGIPYGGLINTLEGFEGNDVDGYVDFNIRMNVNTTKYEYLFASKSFWVYQADNRILTNGVYITGSSVLNAQTLRTTVSNARQKINSSNAAAGDAVPAPDMSGTGYKYIGRNNSTDVVFFNETTKMTATQPSFNSTNVQAPMGILRSSTYANTIVGLSYASWGQYLDDTQAMLHRQIMINNL